MTRDLVGSSIEEVERELIFETLLYCRGNRTHAAKLLEISVRTLRYKLRDYAAKGFPVPEVRSAARPEVTAPAPAWCHSVKNTVPAEATTLTNSTPVVIGPLGNVLTHADLPPANTSRWVMRRKAEVVLAVEGGLLSIEGACSRYGLTLDEFSRWKSALARHGLRGLRATSGLRQSAPVTASLSA
jgi:hypothetical protein